MLTTNSNRSHLNLNAFGSLKNGRNFSVGSGYRFGFNGKEKDKESFNEAYDFGARIYDGRLGRWMSVDPLSNKLPDSSPFIPFLNNPLLLVDVEGKFPIPYPSIPPIYLFCIKHPIIAANIGQYSYGSTNISTNAARFSGRIGLEEPKEMGKKGTQVNAFRHVLWQANVSASYDNNIAKKVGDAHEVNPNAANKGNLKTTFKASELDKVDETIDLLNNVIGRAIGQATKGKTMQFQALTTLEYYKTNGLWTATKIQDNDGNLIGFKITQNKLPQVQYLKAKKTIQNLNEVGRTSEEQGKINQELVAQRNRFKGPKI